VLGAGVGGGGFEFFEGVPGAAVGALAEPFGVDAAAVVADELGAGFSHWVRRDYRGGGRRFRVLSCHLHAHGGRVTIGA